ncbi:hypothetical protein EYZ11_012507 [Aspergillus tanneri]|uniref:Uncharacterized protein n=1 Tax=Aspergillus tanneri TaxID=1220188 RepID=A0A4S3J036_9EURO|nr:hypothetical protein EYZ11_012507 [Aspergillus tanneri]
MQHLQVRDLSRATEVRIELEMAALLAAEAVKTARYLRRQYTKTHSLRAWKQYTRARNRKKRLVAKALRQGHRRRVQEAIEGGSRGLWRLSKWARNREGAYDQGVTPPLKTPYGLAETMEQKVNILRDVFFPIPPPADLSDITNAEYPEPIELLLIERHEVETVVRDAPVDKAPGEDTIPNSLWHRIIDIPELQTIICNIFNACIQIGYNPQHFQQSVTVVLRKGGEDRDYREPKAYRPVALLNTLGRFLEAIVARRLSYAVEEYRLLPDTHLGGRKGISTDHAVQLLIDKIKHKWGRKHAVVTLVLLDVSGAYDNVAHLRLLHNLRQRRLGWLVP